MSSENFVDIPIERLSPEILRAIIEEFVTREGTDYGDRQFTLDEKVSHIRRALEGGQARVVYDPASDSTTILERRKPGI
jgi:uncharacterized protein YheU (UPF0270 family)